MKAIGMKPFDLAKTIEQIIAKRCNCHAVWTQNMDGSPRGPVTPEEAEAILLDLEKLMMKKFEVSA